MNSKKNGLSPAQKKRKRHILTAVFVAAVFLGLLIALHNNPLDDSGTVRLKKICGYLLLGTSVVLICGTYDKLLVLPKELWQSRRLIWRLAKNDFRKRYAGSIFGAVWAMIPPIVTVIMYWVVFDRIFGQHTIQLANGEELPYVVFLTAGLVPWFFFSDALNSGTASLLEYNYLVKKVVFKISVLPIIKIIAALFTHLFFTAILLVIAVIAGYEPSIYWIQLIYYTAAEFLFVLGLCYATCAITVFFRDLQQIIGIVLQVGMWATPILWDINMLQNSPWIVLIKMNPMTYIVNGYRNAIFEKQWFWYHFYSSTYFWMATILMFCIGSLIFKKLKVAFADVL
ncbi:MAG: ABC transporter permease [Lachnospiraceae bacterium]|nr:ABC transporter permease [Lachnospiraceae bacterium]